MKTLDSAPSFVNNSDTIHYLSHLLPYDPIVKIGKRLESGLKEYLLLLNAAEETIYHLEQGELKAFDPLVGENSCQIRALKLALTIQHCTFDTKKLLDFLITAKLKITKTLSEFYKINKRNLSLKCFLERENCDIQITSAEEYLIRAFILTRTKIVDARESLRQITQKDITDPKRVKEFGDVSATYAEAFVTHLRKKTSVSSVKFIQGIAKNLCPKNPNAKLHSQDFIAEHNGLDCLPCYWITRIALEQSLIHRTPIAIIYQQKAKNHEFKHIEQAIIFYEATTDGYKPICKSKLEPESPALVMTGSYCRELENLPHKENWLKELIEYCPIELALACSAAHRQYPDESKDLRFSDIDDSDYHAHKIKAVEWGCTLENPSLFFLTHIHCEKIKNLLHV